MGTSEDDEYDGSSGDENSYEVDFEEREIVIGYGAQFHIWADMKAFWEKNLSGQVVNLGDTIVYLNRKQGVRWTVEGTILKSRFKEALETDGIMVVYQGHSRHGNGACFAEKPDQFPEDGEPNVPGNHWGDGTTDDDGMYRMGKPFMCMPLSELRENLYLFAPVATSEEKPSKEDRDAHAQGSVSKLKLPVDLQGYVMYGYESETHEYWAVNGKDILMSSGWTGTRNDPYDIGATQMNCRVFCHFGCSTREHFREIVRGDAYKAWQRDDPPTDRFAYFTTAPAPMHGTLYFVHYLLGNDVPSQGESWAKCLWEARKLANQRLRRERVGFEIY